jgi:hypothetical protein
VSNPTLMDVFFKEEGALRARLSLADSANVLSELKQKLAQNGSKIPFPLFRDQAMEKAARDLMNVRLDTILFSAWAKSPPLKKYLDREKYPADSTITVAVGEHTVNSEHHPWLEASIGGIDCRINFGITLALKLKSSVLVIKDGRIKALKPGECSANGTVTCQNVQILEKVPETIPLTTFDLGEGFPIEP